MVKNLYILIILQHFKRIEISINHWDMLQDYYCIEYDAQIILIYIYIYI